MASYSFLKKLEVLPSAFDMKMLKDATEWALAALNIALVPLRGHASVVVGGSYAKGTLVTSQV